MGFFDRLFNVISGFFNSLIGGVEANNPEMVFEAAIQERKKKQAELHKAVSGIVHLRNKTEAELREKEKLLQEVEESIEIAVDEGDDQSAEVLLEQQVELEARVAELAEQLATTQKQADDAKAALESYRASIEKLKREKHEVVAKAKTAEARLKIQEELDGLSLDSDSQALDNVREAVDKKSAQADVGAELASNNIEQRIANIKSKTGNLRAKKKLAELKAKKSKEKDGDVGGADQASKRNI